jgi:hypothetical protein
MQPQQQQQQRRQAAIVLNCFFEHHIPKPLQSIDMSAEATWVRHISIISAAGSQLDSPTCSGLGCPSTVLLLLVAAAASLLPAANTRSIADMAAIQSVL